MSKAKQVRIPPLKEFFQMSADELCKLGERLSKAPALPVPPDAQERHDRILHKDGKRGRGRPKIGDGAAKVLVSIEKGLLAKADTLARISGISRSELVARGLKLALRKAG